MDELEDTKGTKKLSKERNHFHNHQPANCAKLSASSRAVLVSPTLCLQLQSNGSALSLKSSVTRVAGRTPEGDRGYFLSKKDKLDKKEKTLVGERRKDNAQWAVEVEEVCDSIFQFLIIVQRRHRMVHWTMDELRVWRSVPHRRLLPGERPRSHVVGRQTLFSI